MNDSSPNDGTTPRQGEGRVRLTIEGNYLICNGYCQIAFAPVLQVLTSILRKL